MLIGVMLISKKIKQTCEITFGNKTLRKLIAFIFITREVLFKSSGENLMEIMLSHTC